MIKRFIENADFSDIPIGPQAELIEEMEQLNSQIPDYLDIKLDVTKKFRWKTGTYKKVEALYSYFLGTNQRYKNVNEIFDKPERNRRNYYLTRFRRDIGKVNNILDAKRATGAIWSEDDTIIEEIKQKAIEKALTIFDEYLSYQELINNNDIKYYHIDGKVSSATALDMINGELNDSFKFEDETSKIILDDKERSISIMHPFKDILMNVYRGNASVPMFRYKNGNILSLYKIDLKRLMYWAVGCQPRRIYRGSISSKFWYKPLIRGNKHPFVQFPDRHRLVNHEMNVDSWEISYDRVSGTCAGNFNYIHGGQNDISVVKWCEEVYTWLTTFRTGITHPLNSISTCYYGDPENHDENMNPDYLDVIGIDTRECSNRMMNYYFNAQDRQNICNEFCTESIMSSCTGYNIDIRTIRAEKLRKWSERRTHIDEMSIEDLKNEQYLIIAESSYPGNFNPDHEGTDDDYPTSLDMEETSVHINPEESLQQDMLRWVRNNS